uniref:NADH dehydrogenase subunit 6 n=1 Tax=Blastopsylla occidentalis TaxID=121832 RepID=A0A2U9QJH9_BLAOC|nr:NADH dehydrogenase subunit 6 [Blastopsylla occidentalis]AWU48867.1 NADH dehydrogenase subunit 6 [Blastopsylla occidentalis]
MLMKILMLCLLNIFWLSSYIFNPLSLGFLILMQTIVTCLLSRILSNSSWMSMTLFLVMVGGLMIVFIYMTSISSNEVFLFPKLKFSLQIIVIWILILNLNFKNNFNNDSLFNMDIFNKEFYKIFLPLNTQSSIFSFLYLLFTLMIIVYLMEMNKGPLRKKY